jgi:hypothetical protein
MLYSSFLLSADLRRLQQPERERNQNGRWFWAARRHGFRCVRAWWSQKERGVQLAFAPTRHY